MKVGILQFFGWRDRSVPLNSVYETALERFSIMDQTGYDAVWLAEHHFSSFSVCPSVHMMGTMAAARTKRLRIGTAVSLAPFYNPLRLAEEVALLDVLSGGRVNWGAGRGFERSEFAAFGIPGEESAPRFHETVDIVLKAWTNQRLSYQGKFYQYENVEVLPKPFTRDWAELSVAGARPGIGIEFHRVELRGRLFILIGRNLPKVHDPFSAMRDRLALPVAAQFGIQPPVNEHAVAGLAEPIHAGLFGRIRGRDAFVGAPCGRRRSLGRILIGGMHSRTAQEYDG